MLSWPRTPRPHSSSPTTSGSPSSTACMRRASCRNVRPRAAAPKCRLRRKQAWPCTTPNRTEENRGYWFTDAVLHVMKSRTKAAQIPGLRSCRAMISTYTQLGCDQQLARTVGPLDPRHRLAAAVQREITERNRARIGRSRRSECLQLAQGDIRALNGVGCLKRGSFGLRIQVTQRIEPARLHRCCRSESRR
jgi:hypothetical protein